MSRLQQSGFIKNAKTSVSILVLLLAFIGSAHAASKALSKNTQRSVSTLSLQNLERERAAMIQDLLNPDFTLEQRLQQLTKRQRQLTDMERMVMRDERLVRSDSAHVQRAFADYESTFLVHAGAENKRTAGEQWLATINMSNQAIMNSRMGFRK